ncbi:thioesterase II family protein [Streptomyces griseorubiginosus]|uniref:thioesterase II family protein n=1 Tax=Streptomyces griseorubiginosus TaxID=67304 RepID=UPI00215AE5A1|nr:alpha/beta fold hydrolase [Streptomyces griseorubiginosus]
MSSPWYSVYAPRPAALVRLYCLPCAGGGSTMFRAWADRLPPTMELRAIRLPGRHGWHPEPPFTDCTVAADTLASVLGPELRPPYVLFGHSMGALLAHQLILALERYGLPRPALYVSASWLVEGIPIERLPDPADSDEQFVETLRRLGGVPPEVLSDPEVLAFTLPVLRSDFGLCRTYTYRADGNPLSVPVRAMGGVADGVTPIERMARWRHHTKRFLGTRRFAGDHFFVRDQADEVIAVLVDDITAVMAGSQPALPTS